jgi:hypothetical protein
MEEAVSRILLNQIRRYPHLQLADLYKLLHQASMGSEHAVTDEAGARAWLERELATMGDGPQEPLVDEISPTGEIVRVHLRPYVEAGLDPAELLDAFLRTAREYQGSLEHLKEYGEVADWMASAGLLPFLAGHIGEFMDRMEQQGFPAVHHSQIYEREYRPAYRVVARVYLGPAVRPRLCL